MPHRYPQEAALRDGRRVLLRLFSEKDVDALYDFFHRMPLEYRRFAWDNVDNRALIESWGRNVDYAKAFPIIAVDGSKIVADATLAPLAPGQYTIEVTLGALRQTFELALVP